MGSEWCALGSRKRCHCRCKPCKDCGLRPVAMTLLAPRCLAIWMAKRLDLPVAPLIKTVSPDCNFARSVSAAHDDMPGLAIAAAVQSSISSGNGIHNLLCDCHLRHAAVRRARQCEIDPLARRRPLQRETGRPRRLHGHSPYICISLSAPGTCKLLTNT